MKNNIPLLEVEVPLWYKKEEMYYYLRQNQYCEEIAKELSERWAEDLQSAFRKGFEKGHQYTSGQAIDVVVKIKNEEL